MSVQVAVRVRPFNQRELDLQCKLCVQMEDNRTTLLDLENPDNNRNFYFDYSFWSHDGYQIKPNGMFVAKDEKYASQEQVYQTLGQGILDNAWQGYHCTMFAYGQTGSGKSYSVMGYQPNVGIVPTACKEIFERINADQQNQYEVTFSMMEIYNERLQDLLIPIGRRPQQGMKIRESPSLGFYGEGLRKYPVRSFQEIEQRMNEGSKNRSIAATQMNATSSRAHTIVLIELKQKITVNGRRVERFSAMNLVDLAGSEKNDKTGAVGQRLKEASAINKSLSMLGLVISTLADHAIGKNKNTKIPYRDSALTKILKNALGGNSKTVMICALSPASDNYDEILSTLRYADQAKKIKNNAKVNESATDKLIRELKEENNRLNDLVDELSQKINNIGKAPTMEQEQELKYKLQELVDLKQQQEAFNQELENKNKSQEQIIKEMEEQDRHNKEENRVIKQVDQKLPYITNINEDPLLSYQVNYQIQAKNVTVGKKPKNGSEGPDPDIIIQGLGIKDRHCEFVNENGRVYLVPGDDPTVSQNLFINGEKVTKKIEVLHNDRIMIGQNSAFLAKLPGGQIRENTPQSETDIDYEFIQKEQSKQIEQLKKETEQKLQDQFKENMAKRLQEMEDKFQQQLQEYQDRIQEQEEQLEIHQQEEALAQQRAEDAQMLQDEQEQRRQVEIEAQQAAEAEKKRQELMEQKKEAEQRFREEQQRYEQKKQEQRKRVSQEQIKLEQELGHIAPKVNQMNQMADDMNRRVRFKIQVNPDEEEKIKVQVHNREDGTKYTWNGQKALDRYYQMLDHYDIYQNNGGYIEIDDKEQDPFWDYNDAAQGGQGRVELKPLMYKQDIPMEIMLYDKTGFKVIGLLKVHLYETDWKGETNIPQMYKDQSQNIADPNDLLGNRMYIKVAINSAKLPPNVYNSYVQYKLFGKTYKSQIAYGREDPVVYNYERIHRIKEVDDYTLSILAKESIQFTVYGQVDPNEDARFLGQKDDQLEFIHISKEVGAGGPVTKEVDPLRKLWSQKKYVPVVLFGAVSWILYMIQLIVASNYRDSYEVLSDAQESLKTSNDNKDGDDEHLGYWRAFSCMLMSCAVMMSYYFISFLVDKCRFDYLTEFIYASIIPFLIWFFSSIAWLATDRDYQEVQNDIADSTEEGGSCNEDSKLYESFKNACSFGKNYTTLVDLTIYMMFFNTVIYLVYYFTSIKYVKAKQIVINQQTQHFNQNEQQEKKQAKKLLQQQQKQQQQSPDFQNTQYSNSRNNYNNSNFSSNQDIRPTSQNGRPMSNKLSNQSPFRQTYQAQSQGPPPPSMNRPYTSNSRMQYQNQQQQQQYDDQYDDNYGYDNNGYQNQQQQPGYLRPDYQQQHPNGSFYSNNNDRNDYNQQQKHQRRPSQQSQYQQNQHQRRPSVQNSQYSQQSPKSNYNNQNGKQYNNSRPVSKQQNNLKNRNYDNNNNYNNGDDIAYYDNGRQKPEPSTLDYDQQMSPRSNNSKQPILRQNNHQQQQQQSNNNMSGSKQQLQVQRDMNGSKQSEINSNVNGSRNQIQDQKSQRSAQQQKSRKSSIQQKNKRKPSYMKQQSGSSLSQKSQKSDKKQKVVKNSLKSHNKQQSQDYSTGSQQQPQQQQEQRGLDNDQYDQMQQMVFENEGIQQNNNDSSVDFQDEFSYNNRIQNNFD